ncbi:MAG: RdgB/HAM1 family non-canonical purine NTP pyrophosphatase [Thaumarchaeota archaeon]|jgi:XTP/dITP diphosphohydrolase|nr:RdgB/HAM1 family non-canonical purine NTP pyrophosphatase [Nitrososphaerota archaeon]MBT3744269.1 RdgB/HAM1 family non-canonical purine NTP pyrophosphatase [Nitrososphaerota archaeon]MBT4057688.1 RdgB/HAM1 family non-canonical purine NTP pyrophosphatase [Nitrososphaerota archaeon]MBT4509565.1 RdgB/HAM1 family non-canonical purine NTP pyrophosphatase [Nitrososphaerota archaeon]MBT4972702.1 RdgB/HAM1 family non-canonical purine NTP pyrophosphatase [Nitrososphaerota archaeon]|tara:strand:+ start:249 stop:824 length:576 start_codon:yes stop_codon:yes gene_type:complete
MQQSSELFFVSSNTHKFTEAERILSNLGLELNLFKTTLEEIQSNSLSEIAKRKALDAYSKVQKPVIIEDDGLFIDSLDGFPGPYSSYAYDTIGNKGIIRLLENSESRNAKFVAIIAYCNGVDDVQLFESSIPGKISLSIEKGGWGYDPIFIPDGESKTYANVSDKDKFSHRSASLKKFSDWFMHTQLDSGL